MGNFFFGSPPPRTPIGGMGERLFNMLQYQGRGIIGAILIIIFVILLMPLDDMKTKPAKTVMAVWFLIFSFLLIHPIKVPTVAFVPVFLFPVLHVINSAGVCKEFFSQNTALLVIGGYLRDLLNVSGVDKRFTMWLMFADDNSSITNKSLIVKASIASYFLSMVSNRDRVLLFMMNHVVRPLRGLESSSDKEPNFRKMRHILSNAIVTSSAIGSLSIVNGSRNVMFMRILWETSGHPDTFNFLDYFCFAFPCCLVIFVANLVYHIVLSSMAFKDEMSSGKMSSYRSDVLEARESLPKSMSCHERLAILFSLLINITYMTRWSVVLKKITGSFGWAVDKKTGMTTMIPDASVSVVFLVLTALVPITCTPMKICGATRESELPPVKPDSSVLFWKIIDKGMHYGYMFLAGSFSALDAAVRKTGVPHLYLHSAFSFITGADATVALLIVCLLSVVLCNIMTSVAAAGMITIVALNFVPPVKINILLHHYLFILMTGMATSFGFAAQFKNTPAGMHSVNINILDMLPFAVGSIIVCTAVLFIMIGFYAPHIFGMAII